MLQYQYPLNQALYQTTSTLNDDSILTRQIKETKKNQSSSKNVKPSKVCINKDSIIKTISSNSENSKHNSKRKYFTAEEDNLLIYATIKYDQVSWNDIAQLVPGKTPKQCRDRWANYLQPSVNNLLPWSDEENILLISLVQMIGTHWSQMKQYFPQRSTNSIKNRWNWLKGKLTKNILKQKTIEQFSINYAKDQSLANSNNTSFYEAQNKCLFDVNNIQRKNLKYTEIVTGNDSKNDSKMNEINSHQNNVNSIPNPPILENNNIFNDDLISFDSDELNW